MRSIPLNGNTFKNAVASVTNVFARAFAPAYNFNVA